FTSSASRLNRQGTISLVQPAHPCEAPRSDDEDFFNLDPFVLRSFRDLVEPPCLARAPKRTECHRVAPRLRREVPPKPQHVRPLAEQRVGTVRSALLGDEFGCRFDLSNMRATARTTIEILRRLSR